MSPEQRAKIAAKLRGRKDSVLTRQRKQEAQQDRRTLELMARKLIEQTRELNAEERALAAAKEVKRDGVPIGPSSSRDFRKSQRRLVIRVYRKYGLTPPPP